MLVEELLVEFINSGSGIGDVTSDGGESGGQVGDGVVEVVDGSGGAGDGSVESA